MRNKMRRRDSIRKNMKMGSDVLWERICKKNEYKM